MCSLPPYMSMLRGMLPSQQSISFSDHEGAPSALAHLDRTFVDVIGVEVGLGCVRVGMGEGWDG